jgi:integrase
MALTDARLRSLKSQVTDFKLSDGGGLHLLVAKTGSKLWRLSYRFNGKQKTLALGAYTLVRTAEVRFAQWKEFEDLEGHAPLWRIPKERMKMRRAHLVPLSKQAVDALLELRKLTGKSQYVVSAPTKTGVISENTMLFAIYRMGYHSRATTHGFRTTASTALNEQQFNRDWIEMQLAHFDGSVRGIYNGRVAAWSTGDDGVVGKFY